MMAAYGGPPRSACVKLMEGVEKILGEMRRNLRKARYAYAVATQSERLAYDGEAYRGGGKNFGGFFGVTRRACVEHFGVEHPMAVKKLTAMQESCQYDFFILA